MKFITIFKEQENPCKCMVPVPVEKCGNWCKCGGIIYSS